MKMCDMQGVIRKKDDPSFLPVIGSHHTLPVCLLAEYKRKHVALLAHGSLPPTEEQP